MFRGIRMIFMSICLLLCLTTSLLWIASYRQSFFIRHLTTTPVYWEPSAPDQVAAWARLNRAKGWVGIYHFHSLGLLAASGMLYLFSDADSEIVAGPRRGAHAMESRDEWE